MDLTRPGSRGSAPHDGLLPFGRKETCHVPCTSTATLPRRAGLSPYGSSARQMEGFSRCVRPPLAPPRASRRRRRCVSQSRQMAPRSARYIDALSSIYLYIVPTYLGPFCLRASRRGSPTSTATSLRAVRPRRHASSREARGGTIRLRQTKLGETFPLPARPLSPRLREQKPQQGWPAMRRR